MKTITREDLERRAKARGWTVSLPVYTQTVLVYDDVGWLATYRRLARFPPEQWWWCAEAYDPMVQVYLDGITEAREGAARVLSVVAQVAAMQCAALLQADMVRALSSTSDALEQQADDWCTEARELRREVLRLRHRLRSRNDCHPSGDRLHPEDLDALLCRGLWGRLRTEDDQKDITRYLLRELRGRREHGTSSRGVWPRAVHGPKGRLP